MDQMNWSSLFDFGFPLLRFLVMLLVLHLFIKLSRPYFVPAFLNRFSVRYNKAMGSFKQDLLKDLESLREKPTGKEASVNSDAPPSLTVMEIGVGTGANFKYYPDGTTVIAIEPNKNFAGYLEKNVAEYSPRVRLQRTVVAFAEDLRGHVDDCSVDAVVSTLVLCSVRDTDAVVREARRVLKPGGKFFFLEHVAADPETWTRTLQWFLRPICIYLAGCYLITTPWVNIDRAGFAKVQYKRFTAPPKILKFVRPHLMGVATK